MSRRHHEETSFGSDSFLDVIANIVGILIILIVVAGVKVSRAPLLQISQSEPELTEIEPELAVIELEPIVVENDGPPIDVEFYNDAEVQVIEAAPDFIPPTPTPLPAIAEAQVLPVLTQQVEDLKEKKAELDRQIAMQSKSQAAVLKLQTSKAKSFESHRQQVDKLAEELRTKQQLLTITAAENSKSQQIVEQLLDKTKNVESKEPPTEQLAHRLNPVGRVVSGKEVHFCLLNDGIAYVPVQELSELVKDDMRRRRDYLLKQPRFQSTVGPVNGFEMEYLVQRESGSIFDDARYGSGMVRVAVSDWVLRPTQEVLYESLDQALQENSQFRAALLSQGTNATITFWVYPNSFNLHHELKKIVHDSGFWVASRPLPAGFPIAGSATNGSKSIAQ